MQRFSASPLEMFASCWRHRGLVARMVQRDVLGRYRGSIGGVLWSLVTPLLMLGIYTFVFGTVFKARWQAGSGSSGEFAVMVFAGLVVFGIFSECANRAPTLILSQPNYVKKVIFPLEVMPWIALGSALFHAAIGLVVLLAFVFVVHGALPWTASLLPLALLPLVFVALGLGWLLGALGVFLRDLAQAVTLATSALMFLSPVFFSLEALPEAYRAPLAWNPLAVVIGATRAVLIEGRGPEWPALGLAGVAALAFAWGSFAVFQRTRKGFGDVL